MSETKRVFKYNGQSYQDRGLEYSVDEVKKHLAAVFPEVAQAATEKKTLENGYIEITFVKRAGTKGAEPGTVPIPIWAIVDLFGHTQIAGGIREVEMLGGKMLLVSVPETSVEKPFARHFSLGAIYSITEVSENEATDAACLLGVLAVPGYLRPHDYEGKDEDPPASDPWDVRNTDFEEE